MDTDTDTDAELRELRRVASVTFSDSETRFSISDTLSPYGERNQRRVIRMSSPLINGRFISVHSEPGLIITAREVPGQSCKNSLLLECYVNTECKSSMQRLVSRY